MILVVYDPERGMVKVLQSTQARARQVVLLNNRRKIQGHRFPVECWPMNHKPRKLAKFAGICEGTFYV